VNIATFIFHNMRMLWHCRISKSHIPMQCRGNDALPEGLEDTLKTIAEARLAPDAANRFDSLPADMAKGRLKSNQHVMGEITSRQKIDQIVEIYNDEVSAILKVNGYGTGRGAA
jgi:hypothetical protein